MASRSAYLQVIGGETGDSAPSLLLFLDQERFIFNIGEGSQRICAEHKVRLSRLKHVFLTRMAPHAIGGLIGMKLTAYDAGLRALTVHGPEGLNQFFTAADPFSYRPDFKLSIDECRLARDAEGGLMVHERQPSKDLKVHIIPVPLSKADNIRTAVSYICCLPATVGKFDVKRAKELGCPPGPLYGVLQTGKSITCKHSITGEEITISPEQIMEKPHPPRVFAVLDCPTLECAKEIFTHKTVFQFDKKNTTTTTTTTEKKIELIVHITPQEVFQSTEYQQYLSEFGETTGHIVINKEQCAGNMIFRASTLSFAKLQYAQSANFPNFASNSQDNDVEMNENKNNMMKKNYREGRLLLKYGLKSSDIGKSVESRFDNTESIKNNITSDDIKAATIDLFSNEDLKMIDDIRASMYINTNNNNMEDDDTIEIEDPELVFLGTGCAVPSKYRNVSCTLLHLQPNSYFLMDCGEGTLGQLVRLYGCDKADDIVKHISCVYISHMHADHHLGLMSILQRRKQLNETKQNMCIVGPCGLDKWLEEYNASYSNTSVQDLYKFIDCYAFEVSIKNPNMKTLSNNATVCLNMIESQLGLVSFQTMKVLHCRNAYGLVITHKNGWKMVYSGDTEPSPELEYFGKDAKVLIHEATFATGMDEEAKQKRHATIAQAVDSGIRMNADRIILTHFSQRYPKFPILDNFQVDRTFFAFDFMTVKFSQLHDLPKLCKSLQLLFQDEEEAEIEKKNGSVKRKREAMENNASL